MATSLIACFKDGQRPKAEAIISAAKNKPSLAAEVDAETGNTPLHFACCNGAPLSVVRALLTANKKAAKAVDKEGNLPILGAVANGCGADVVCRCKCGPKCSCSNS